MSSVAVRKPYIAMGVLVFLVILFLNNKQTIQCIDSSPAKTVSPIDLPIIYGITPTYARLTQKADLTRLSQTLMLVKNFHWIVIEDSITKTPLVANLLKDSGLTFTHLNVKGHKDNRSLASGVEQRNKALDWLRSNEEIKNLGNGIVYFMDDDNTYSLRVFDEMRKIKKVGIWPVGLVGGMRVEMPLVDSGKVVGFNAVWKPDRPFPIDMAGFAINVDLILNNPNAQFSRKVSSGYQETEILKHVTVVEDLEPLADNCSKVYVWHTRTQKPQITNPAKIKVKIVPDSHIEV